MSALSTAAVEMPATWENNSAAVCRLILLSPRTLTAEGIRQGLENHQTLILQAHYQDIGSFFNQAQILSCTVLLINAELIQYPLGHFFKSIRDKVPHARILVFSADASNAFLRSLLHAGVYGHVSVNASMEDLCLAIHTVNHAQLCFNKPLLDEMIFDAIAFDKRVEQSFKDKLHLIKNRMTHREQQIFCLILEGLSTRDIAAQIHMSEPTVKKHLTNLFERFDVSNRTQLILSVFEKVSPINNMIELFRHTLGQCQNKSEFKG